MSRLMLFSFSRICTRPASAIPTRSKKAESTSITQIDTAQFSKNVAMLPTDLLQQIPSRLCSLAVRIDGEILLPVNPCRVSLIKIVIDDP